MLSPHEMIQMVLVFVLRFPFLGDYLQAYFIDFDLLMSYFLKYNEFLAAGGGF